MLLSSFTHFPAFSKSESTDLLNIESRANLKRIMIGIFPWTNEIISLKDRLGSLSEFAEVNFQRVPRFARVQIPKERNLFGIQTQKLFCLLSIRTRIFVCGVHRSIVGEIVLPQIWEVV